MSCMDPGSQGKQPLAREVLKQLDLKTLEVNADLRTHSDIFSSRSLETLKSVVAGYELLFIDEAQRIPDIGINLKILTDNVPYLKIFVTGSSSLDLANKIKEPLTGRTWTYRLHPLAYLELRQHFSTLEMEEKLPLLLQYGSYPEVFTTGNSSDKEQLLMEIADAYLYKDILELEEIRYPENLDDNLFEREIFHSEQGELPGVYWIAVTTSPAAAVSGSFFPPYYFYSYVWNILLITQPISSS